MKKTDVINTIKEVIGRRTIEGLEVYENEYPDGREDTTITITIRKPEEPKPVAEPVNEGLSDKEINQLAQEVIRGKWGINISDSCTSLVLHDKCTLDEANLVAKRVRKILGFN